MRTMMLLLLASAACAGDRIEEVRGLTTEVRGGEKMVVRVRTQLAGPEGPRSLGLYLRGTDGRGRPLRKRIDSTTIVARNATTTLSGKVPEGLATGQRDRSGPYGLHEFVVRLAPRTGVRQRAVTRVLRLKVRPARPLADLALETLKAYRSDRGLRVLFFVLNRGKVATPERVPFHLLVRNRKGKVKLGKHRWNVVRRGVIERPIRPFRVRRVKFTWETREKPRQVAVLVDPPGPGSSRGKVDESEDLDNNWKSARVLGP